MADAFHFNYVSTILVLMATFLHKTTSTQSGKHWPPPHWLWHRKIFTIWMRLVHFIVPNHKTLVQGKVCGCEIQKDQLTLYLAINTTSTDKLRHVSIYKSLHPRCFGRWLPTNYVWWFGNQMAWMTSYVFESWMMSLNVHFKLWTNSKIHSLEHVSRGESFGFQPCS